MVRLRNALMAMALGTGVMGCYSSHFAHYSPFHCDECDDFPTPAYGPGYSMMPGTYTGPGGRDSLESNRPATSTPSSGSNPSATQPGASSTSPASAPTPPAPPAAIPGQGASARPPAAGATGSPSTVVTGAEPNLPILPYSARNRLPVSVTTSEDGGSRR